ncbi:MAG: hypothetical protein EPN85_03550 [Bacteroidetes bacterium]|nr:MAG: hypothetical protein EPN85_03550 [Bacteroidota bacterium]
MSELDKNEWLSKHAYEYEGEDNNLVLVTRETHSDLIVNRIPLEDGSITKFLLNQLKADKAI